MNKLLKLSETHYIIVDDSEIKDGEWVLVKSEGGRTEILWFVKIQEGIPKFSESQEMEYVFPQNEDGIDSWQKITHSFGIELEGVINKPLSEVEEAINGYSVDCKEALLKEIELINKGKSNLSSTYRKYILSYE